MKQARLQPSSILLGSVATLLGINLLGMSQVTTVGPPRALSSSLPLTPEEKEILGHMSIVYLDDGLGNPTKTIRISDVNVQVVNGLGATASANGVGNLIVGYDETLPLAPYDRTGSHNLVTGEGHSYSAFGGFVAGFANTIEGEYTSVSGGAGNVASGLQASVGGGYANLANGYAAAVSGGHSNSSTGFGSWTAGGSTNTASGFFASAVGGGLNLASNNNSLASGGWQNIASGVQSTTVGGRSNEASGSGSAVLGGENNICPGDAASISGGFSNQSTGSYSTVAGGANNLAHGESSSVTGGANNSALGTRSSVSGGQFNSCGFVASFASVSGGYQRSVSTTLDWAAGSLFEDQ